MRLANYTVEDCIRAIGELYRVYGIPFRELSYADWARIINIAYAVVNIAIEAREPRFFYESLRITSSGQRLPDTFFYPLSFRMLPGGAVARYATPMEWANMVTMPQSRYRSFSPVYTIWGGLFLPGAIANPTDNTLGITYTPPASPDGVYIYYLPEGEGILEYVGIPGFLGITPGFLSNRITVPFQVWDTFISFAAVLGLLVLNEHNNPNALTLVEFAQAMWMKFAQGIALAIGRNLEENPLVGGFVSDGTSAGGTADTGADAAPSAGESGRQRRRGS